jgi:Protein of unknown function (DUF3047)
MNIASPDEPRRRRWTLGRWLVVAGATALGIVACVAPRGATPPAATKDRGSTVVVDDFEGWAAGQEPAAPWIHEPFRGVPPTEFRVRGARGERYLSARAEAGGSLLTRPLDVDSAEHRVLRFRWRVRVLPDGANLRRRDGDDCGIRVFVTFAYEPERASFTEKMARSLAGRDLPGSSLCYVWADRVPVGTVLPNAFADRTQMIVVESGGEKLNRWSSVERDVRADYVRAFGRQPPRITGIAVMVDADQTKARAAADIDDLELRRFDK